MKNKIITIVFLIIIIGLGFISIVAKDNLLSTFERRKLATFPKLDKNFTSKLDDYLLDQFVFRNKLINLNSFINRKVLNKIDNNDVYVVGDNIYDKTYPLDEKQVTNFTKKVLDFSKLSKACFALISSSKIPKTLLPLPDIKLAVAPRFFIVVFIFSIWGKWGIETSSK